MAYSHLLSHDTEYDSKDYTSEDIKNMLNEDVSNAQIDLCKKVITLLGQGVSYKKINDFIDSYKFDEDDNLLEDQKTYIKVKTTKDINKRKINLERGDNNE